MNGALLHSYRISKYDPKYRVDGIYTRDEWTSMSDIGRTYNGQVVTRDEYDRVETAYLSVVKKLCLLLDIDEIQLTGLEDYFNNCTHCNGAILMGAETIIKVVRDCLREEYWCQLIAPKLEIHFGYDYYLYVCCSLEFEQVNRLALDVGLFVEVKELPTYDV